MDKTQATTPKNFRANRTAHLNALAAVCGQLLELIREEDEFQEMDTYSPPSTPQRPTQPASTNAPSGKAPHWTQVSTENEAAGLYDDVDPARELFPARHPSQAAMYTTPIRHTQPTSTNAPERGATSMYQTPMRPTQPAGAAAPARATENIDEILEALAHQSGTPLRTSEQLLQQRPTVVPLRATGIPRVHYTMPPVVNMGFPCMRPLVQTLPGQVLNLREIESQAMWHELDEDTKAMWRQFNHEEDEAVKAFMHEQDKEAEVERYREEVEDARIRLQYAEAASRNPEFMAFYNPEHAAAARRNYEEVVQRYNDYLKSSIKRSQDELFTTPVRDAETIGAYAGMVRAMSNSGVPVNGVPIQNPTPVFLRTERPRLWPTAVFPPPTAPTDEPPAKRAKQGGSFVVYL